MSFWKILGITVLVAVALMLVVVVDLIICYGIMSLTRLQVDTTAYTAVSFVVMFVVTAALMALIMWLCFKCDRSL